jgi:hypothetical protein
LVGDELACLGVDDLGHLAFSHARYALKNAARSSGSLIKIALLGSASPPRIGVSVAVDAASCGVCSKCGIEDAEPIVEEHSGQGLWRTGCSRPQR